MQPNSSPTHRAPIRDRAPSSDPRRARILAKTVYRELRSSGIDEREVLAVTTELLGLVTQDIRARRGD